MTTKAPNSRRNLDIAIERYAEGRGDAVQMRRTLANAVVGQMLPSGVVKGGSSLKLRFGEGGARASRDLDTARAEDLGSFIEKLERNLEAGWNGFTGTIAPGRPAKPRGVPEEYVMKPYFVRLSYNGKSWLTVPLEVGHNEIGDADEADYEIAADIAEMFATLGFSEPSPVALMRSHHQIAQKIHAVTTPGGSRAHDLVDLQVICSFLSCARRARGSSPTGSARSGRRGFRPARAGRSSTTSRGSGSTCWQMSRTLPAGRTSSSIR